MNITATVLTYNHEYLLKDCLESVNGQTGLSEKIVVDNGSDIPLGEHLCPGWKVRRTPSNWGNIGGQNLCFHFVSDEWVLFIANDVRLMPDCVEQLIKLATLLRLAGVRVGQIQPVLYRQDGRIDQAGMDWRWPGYGISRWWSFLKPLYTERVEIVPSTCYLMKRDVWYEVGMFDESLGTSHEDVDMGIRLKKAGYHNYVCADAQATHLVNQTLKHTIQNPSHQFQVSRMMVLRKHYRWLNYWTRWLAVKTLHYVPRKARQIVGWWWRVPNQWP